LSALLNLWQRASKPRIRHLIKHLLTLLALFNGFSLLCLLDGFEDLLLLQFLEDLSLVLNQVSMREWEVVDALIAVLLLLISDSLLIAVFKLLISFDKGLFLDFLVFGSIHLLLIKLVVSKLNEFRFAVLRRTPLLRLRTLFLFNLFLEVTHHIFVVFVVKHDALAEPVA